MSGTMFRAFEVRAGVDTIVERTERGTVKAKLVIVANTPCRVDFCNVHLVEKSGRILCYFREAQVEIL
jgi:hypothetical protein